MAWRNRQINIDYCCLLLMMATTATLVTHHTSQKVFMRNVSFWSDLKKKSFIYFGILQQLPAIQNQRDPSSEALLFSEEGRTDVRVPSSYYSNSYGRAEKQHQQNYPTTSIFPKRVTCAKYLIIRLPDLIPLSQTNAVASLPQVQKFSSAPYAETP